MKKDKIIYVVKLFIISLFLLLGLVLGMSGLETGIWINAIGLFIFTLAAFSLLVYVNDNERKK